MKDISISIVVPIFNRANIVNETLRSICIQKGNWECILVDDYSTDNVSEICHAYVKKDARFKYTLNKKAKGAPSARNIGALMAKGSYIFFFDSDNILHKNALQKIQHKLHQSECDILVFFGRVLNENSQYVNTFNWKCYNNIHKELLTGKAYVDNNLCVIKKKCLFEIGLTDEDCPSYQEWDTHIRLSEKYKYETLEEELIDYIQWEKDSISSNKKKTIEGLFYVLEKHFNKFRVHQNALFKYCIQIDELSKQLSNNDQKETKKRIVKLIPNFHFKYRMHKTKEKTISVIEIIRNKLKFNY